MTPRTARACAVLALAALPAVGLAACGDATTGAGSTSGSVTVTPTDATTTPGGSATSSPTAGSGRMTRSLAEPVVLTRSGGLAGVKDRLEIRPDGTYTVISTREQRPRSRQLSEAVQARIVAALDAADLASLARGSTTTPQVADGYFYTLSAQGRSVRLSEPVPDRAQPLITELQALLSGPAPTP
jgi:hypothetical protein